MGPLRLFGPLLFLFILSPLSECLKPSNCRTTEISYDGGPLDIFMESNTDDNALCTYTVRYSQIEGHLDCGSYISISITGGAQTCEEGQVGEEKEFRCNCRWERCMDDIIEGLHADKANMPCLLKMKEAFDAERIATDTVQFKDYTSDTTTEASLTAGTIAGIVGGIIAMSLLIVGFAAICICWCCCAKTDKKERGPELVPVGPMSPMGPMGPVGPIGYNAPMGGPLAPMPIAQVEAPPFGTVPYPNFNPNEPSPMGYPPPMVQVGAPPLGTSPYPQFDPSMGPGNFQQMPQQPMDPQYGWNMGYRQ